MKKITTTQWSEFDKIGIARCLVEEQACGLWFKNVGSEFCVNNEQKKMLAVLNTSIQASR